MRNQEQTRGDPLNSFELSHAFRTPSSIFLRVVEMLFEWRERRIQRRHLAMMDHHMLHDIGLSRADVDQEVTKPFWRG